MEHFKMTEHEENAREIITRSIAANVTISEAILLWVSSGNTEPVLTDSECQAVSVNCLFSWQEIRDCFNTGNPKTIRQRFTNNAEQFDALMVEMLAENEKLKDFNSRLQGQLHEVVEVTSELGIIGVVGSTAWKAQMLRLKLIT